MADNKKKPTSYFCMITSSKSTNHRTQWTAQGSILGAVRDFFVCVWISETAERICAKLTRKTCLVPQSEKFEGQGQRSKIKVTMGKKRHFSALSVAFVRFGKTSLASSFNTFFTVRPKFTTIGDYIYIYMWWYEFHPPWISPTSAQYDTLLRVVQMRVQQIQDGGRQPYWKIENHHTYEICHDAHIGLLDPLWKFQVFKNPRWRTAASLKIENSGYSSATVWRIAMKFGMVTRIGPLNPICRRNVQCWDDLEWQPQYNMW